MAWLTIRGPGGTMLVHRLEAPGCILGRSEDANVLLPDPSVSRRHAEVRPRGDGWEVLDLGSRNGTLINGEPLRGAHRLEAGDEVTFGDTQVWFETSESMAKRRGLQRETQDVGPAAGAPFLVADSPAMREVLDLVERAAPRDVSVLITGEPGTGKEVIARLVHFRSRRSEGPFVVVNCPAVPTTLFESELFGVERGVATGVDARPGKVEQAAGGTLFLDEIGDLDMAVQAKLLRLLQDRTYERVGGRTSLVADVRFVSATNHDLSRAVAAGRFRKDLHHRLDVIGIHLPPLRDRREDIPALLEHFLRSAGGPGLNPTPEVLARLRAHRFSGNVRELQHVATRASIMSDGPDIGVEQLPDRFRGQDEALDSTEVRPHEIARRLLDDILDGRATFWDAIQKPFLRRELSRDTVRAFVALAREQGGGRYIGMARLLGIEAQHKKLLDFLRNHDLQGDDE